MRHAESPSAKANLFRHGMPLESIILHLVGDGLWLLRKLVANFGDVAEALALFSTPRRS